MKTIQMSIDLRKGKQNSKIHTTDYYLAVKENGVWIQATLWMDLKIIVLSERNQTLLDYILFDSNFQKKQIYRESNQWLPRTGAGGVGTVCKQWRRPFWSDGSGLKLDYRNVTQLYKCIKSTDLYTMVSTSYLNKAFFFLRKL